MIKVLKKEIILPFLLICVSFIFWKHIPSLQFIGEGYYYFSEHAVKYNIFERVYHELFARLLFSVLPSWFEGNVHLYMWFLFAYMLVINLALYIALRIITKSKVLAFFIAVLFSTSYVGQYDMYSTGGYQYFVQRGAILLPLIFSFMFYVLYFIQEFKASYLAISLVLYIFGIIMGFFGTWFLPPFIFYPFFYFLFNLKKSRLLAKAILAPLPFLLTNALLIRQSGFIPDESLLEFFFNNFGYVIVGVLQQLAVVTPFLEDLLKFYGKESLLFQIVLALTPLLYFGALIKIKKLGWQYQVLASTAMMSLLTMLLFNVYLNGANVLHTFGSSRYFYFPFTMVAVFWGPLLAAFFSHKRAFTKTVVVTILLVWVVYNNYAIKRNLKADEWLHNVHRTSLDYLRSWSEDLKDKPSYVYHPLGPYGSAFALRFLSHPEGKFMVQGFEELDLEGLAKQGVAPERLYVLYVDPALQIVIDKTKESREHLTRLEER